MSGEESQRHEELRTGTREDAASAGFRQASQAGKDAAVPGAGHEWESEPLFRHMADTAPVMIWMSGVDGMCFWFNKPWLAFTGRSLEEESGEGWARDVHPDDRQRCLDAYWSAFREKRPFKMEYRLRRHDGVFRWVLDHGVPRHARDGAFIGFIGSCIDITRRRETEDKLRKSETDLRASEARLRMLVESAAEFAIMTLDAEGRIKTWSAGAERIFGYTEEEVRGRNFEILFLPEDRGRGAPAMELEKATRDGFASDERWHIRKDGAAFFASGSASPIRGVEPPEFVKIARDLTDRKQMEEALREADRRKNEFLATLAHELRNPLAPIRSGIDLLNRAGYNRRLVDRTLRVIERQTNQIVHLVDDLLDISRITQGKIHLKVGRVDLRQLVKLVVDHYREAIRRKEHRLSLSLPDEPVIVEGDPTRLEQIVSNVLSNAVKYTRRGGRISLGLATNEGCAEVVVEDNGIGIPSAKLGEIFEVFSQADDTAEEARTGLGVGLSVVRGLLDLHGGSIEAHSQGPGEGSTFSIRLPLAPEHERPASGSTRPPPSPEPPSEGKRVLVVDDNRDAVAMLQILLTMDGHDVRVAYDGEEAVREAGAFRPHVCLCDIGLPKIDGYEVARRLSADVPETLLISVSGWGQEEDRERSRQAGFKHHLVKPVRIEDVVALLA